MKRRSFSLIAAAAFGGITLALSAPAQNLLTVNSGFEDNTAYYAPGWGWPIGSPDVLPGWWINLDSNGDGYAGVTTNQEPQGLEGTHFGYIYSGSGFAGWLETAPGSRAPVEAGTTYTLWFLARGDSSWAEAFATVSLIWYVDSNDDTTKGEPATLDLTLPMRISTTDPMQSFHITAVAPQAAHYAAVRVARPASDYNPMIMDDFVIMAEPVEITLSARKHGQDLVLSWPRSLSHHLQEASDPAGSEGWSRVDKPPKSVGATSYLDYGQAANIRFFRLAKQD